MSSWARSATAVLAAVLAVGLFANCEAAPTPTSPSQVALDTMPGTGLGTEPAGGCGSVAFEDLQLEADPSESPPLWLRAQNAEDKIYVRWPPGFTARFEPDLVIYDGRGRVAAREGDLLTNASGLPDGDDRPATIVSFNGTDYPCS